MSVGKLTKAIFLFDGAKSVFLAINRIKHLVKCVTSDKGPSTT